MASVYELEKEIKRIKQRNRRVEADKAWETSWIRRILIAIFTYFVIVLFFHFAQLPDPFINSIVPALAFILSTLSLSIIKKYWIKKRNK